MIVENADRSISWVPNWVEKEFMERLGYEQLKKENGYYIYANKAGLKVEGYGIMPKHKRYVYFNTTYEPKEKVVFCEMREDGDTRRVYHGVIKGNLFLEQLLTCVR